MLCNLPYIGYHYDVVYIFNIRIVRIPLSRRHLALLNSSYGFIKQSTSQQHNSYSSCTVLCRTNTASSYSNHSSAQQLQSTQHNYTTCLTNIINALKHPSLTTHDFLLTESFAKREAKSYNIMHRPRTLKYNIIILKIIIIIIIEQSTFYILVKVYNNNYLATLFAWNSRIIEID